MKLGNARYWIVALIFALINVTGWVMVWRDHPTRVEQVANVKDAPHNAGAPLLSPQNTTAPPPAADVQTPPSVIVSAVATPQAVLPPSVVIAPPVVHVYQVLPRKYINEDSISIDFDVDLTIPMRVDAPISTPPFAIVPAVEGFWTWKSPRRLEFRLAKPLPAGRRFVLKATNEADRILGSKLEGTTEIPFETQRIEVTNCFATLTEREDVYFEIHFNQQIAPAELAKYLVVEWPDAAERIEPQIMTQEPATKLTVKTKRPTRDWYNVKILAGLKPATAELELSQDRSFRVIFAPRMGLSSTTATEPNLNGFSSVYIYFTQNLKVEQAMPNVNIEPAVPGSRSFISGNAIVLEGEFISNQRYQFSLSPGILASNGEVIAEALTTYTNIPAMPPRVKVPFGRGILSPLGNMLLDATMVNVSSVSVKAFKVYPNNLIAHLSGRFDGYYGDYFPYDGAGEDGWYYDYEDWDYYDDYSYRRSSRRRSGDLTSKQVLEKTLNLAAIPHKANNIALDLRKLLGEDARGIYKIHLKAQGQYWVGDSATVAITDMGITARRESGKTLAWVTSLATAQPLAGVRVAAITGTNQSLDAATTDDEGFVELKTPADHPDGEPWVIVAEKDGDVSYLLPEDRRWMVEDVQQAGRSAPSSYDVMLYTERGVYRPGDPIYVTGIVRGSDDGAIPDSFPLSLSLVRPDGKSAGEITVNPEIRGNGVGQGFFHGSFPTTDGVQTGPYKIMATLPGSKSVLGETQTLVEAFMPVRIAVEAKAEKELFVTGDAPSAAIKADYLFGQPASDMPLRFAGTYRGVALQSKAFPDYTFGKPKSEKSAVQPMELNLDAQGAATVSWSLPTESGLWSATFVATALDPAGRPVSKNVPFRADTAGRHLGIKLPGRVVSTEKPVSLQWAVQKSDDTPSTAGPIRVTLERINYDYVWKLVNRRHTWDRVEKKTTVFSEALSTDTLGTASGVYEFKLADDGKYRVYATDEETGVVSSLEFYASSYASEEQLIANERPERLEIILDQEKYRPDSLVKALVRSPFPGTLILTLENKGVRERRVVAMTAGTQQLELPVRSAELRGGGYVTASVIRSVDKTATDWLPNRAYGMTYLPLDRDAFRFPVAIEMPAKVLPGETMDVVVRTEPMFFDPNRPTEVHLWAVDEGILLTTDYHAPDPVEHFHARRKPMIASADSFSELLPDYARPDSMVRIGGDAGEGFDPAAADRDQYERPVVIWRSSEPVDAEGIMRAKIALPEFTGKVRLMAVVVERDRYAVAEKPVTMSSPLMIEPTAPRFVAPGDEFEIPVKLFNSENTPFTAELGYRVEGPLDVTLATTATTVVVPPGEPQTIWLHAVARDIGQVHVFLEAKTGDPAQGGHTAKKTLTFPSRPVAVRYRMAQPLNLAAEGDFLIPLPEDYTPGTVDRKIIIGPRPDVQLLPALEELIGYPYGCLEQTTSRLLGMVNAPQVIATEYANDARVGAINDYIKAGINRLWSMQTPSGGLSYWSGASSPDLWGTCYAAKFLLQAKRNNHEIPEAFIKGLLDYLERTLKEQQDVVVDENTRAFMVRVLAGFDRPSEGWMNTLGERLEKLDMEGRADLAAAWLAVGKRDRALTLLNDEVLRSKVGVTLSNRFTSQATQESVLLDVLLDLDANHPWIAQLAKKIESARARRGYWYNTRENAAAISALARYLTAQSGDATFKGELLADGVGMPFDSTQSREFEFSRGVKELRIRSTGTGRVHVSIYNEGVLRAGAFQEKDSNLTVRRRWLTASGTEFTTQTMKSGDMIWSEVTLTAPNDDYAPIENIAVVELLPAGLEVENPRLVTSAQSDAPVKSETVPDRIEFLDDRVLIFSDASKQERKYVYPLRVVKPGDFTIPPIAASSMYDEAYSSVSGGGKRLKVEKR